MDPHTLKAVLRCPVCHRPLRAATTLSCGHTVCAHHPTVPCPLQHCAPPAGPARPRIPPASRVNYLPAPAAPPVPQPPQAALKLDVTVNKIIALLDSVLTDDDDDDSPPTTPTVRYRPDSDSGPSRPRKRQRMVHPESDDDDDLLSHLRAHAARERQEPDEPNLDKELQTELSCEICFTLLYNPVTTPCQHTFCSKCLHRALDHSNLCPLCRDELPGFSFFEDHPTNQTLETLLVTAFPLEYIARGDAIAAEERDARLDTPIFVCMLIFPGHPTALHFFEPRYRLMLRRCLEQDVPSFGMIMPARPGAPPVRSVQMLADGRSMVETWSTYRFRILERGTLDGYTVARIERIDDVPDSPSLGLPLPGGPSNEQLMDTCTQFLQQLRRGTAPWVVQRLNNVYGAPPTDPAQFAYWVALVLPIDEFEKAKLLPIRSTHLRLRMVVQWIEQLSNNWWFTSGCVIF
ncbi:PUA-like domain-containing protein [Mycena olivaceomarginata]|nr:PUA-like domain-containing protein [Mycena olivaceomarginata]